jgi:hypothetical protein
MAKKSRSHGFYSNACQHNTRPASRRRLSLVISWPEPNCRATIRMIRRSSRCREPLSACGALFSDYERCQRRSSAPCHVPRRARRCRNRNGGGGGFRDLQRNAGSCGNNKISCDATPAHDRALVRAAHLVAGRMRLMRRARSSAASNASIEIAIDISVNRRAISTETVEVVPNPLYCWCRAAGGRR